MLETKHKLNKLKKKNIHRCSKKKHIWHLVTVKNIHPSVVRVNSLMCTERKNCEIVKM